MNMKKQHQEGFSLIELMVVLMILGLLISVVAPNVLGVGDKARIQKAQTDITTLETALDNYKLDNGRYPDSEDGLEALITPPDSLINPATYRPGGYIKKIPADPWGIEYIYENEGDGQLRIISAGPDNEEDTEDDITN